MSTNSFEENLEVKNDHNTMKNLIEKLLIKIAKIVGYILVIIIISIFTHYIVQYLTEGDNYINKELKIEKYEGIDKTIDLLNLIIASSSIIFTGLAIFTALYVSRWEQKINAIQLQYELNNEKIKEINNAKAEYEKLSAASIKLQDSITEEIEYLNKFYTLYSRALYRYNSRNFEDSVKVFNRIINLFDKNKEIVQNDKLPIIGDVYFQRATAYFKMGRLYGPYLTEESKRYFENSISDISKAITKYQISINKNGFTDSIDENTNIIYAQAYRALATAYLINRNDKNDFNISNNDQKNYLRDVNKDIGEVLKNLAQMEKNVDQDILSFFSYYNVACTYAVLYKYVDKSTEIREEYLQKAIDYLTKVMGKNAVTKEYVIADLDWDYFVNLPSGKFVPELDKKDRKKFVETIGGEFFSSKSSKWEIAKLYAWLSKLIDKSQNKTKLRKEFASRALLLMEKSLESNLIDERRVSFSKSFASISNVDQVLKNVRKKISKK